MSPDETRCAVPVRLHRRHARTADRRQESPHGFTTDPHRGSVGRCRKIVCRLRRGRDFNANSQRGPAFATCGPNDRRELPLQPLTRGPTTRLNLADADRSVAAYE
jgi:hypothetical protein